MTVKERILATLRGEPTDVIPYVPRLDIWYNANFRAGTLPAPYQKATLREIVDDLGLGYHAIVPDFGDFRHQDGDLDVGLGLYDLHNRPYRIKIHNVKRTHERKGDGRLHVTYETPKGKITTTVVHNQKMVEDGLTLYAITEHAIKSMDDYDAMAFILQNAEVIPHYDPYTRFKEEFIGDRGVAVALSAMFASPGHYLIKELMAIDTFYYEMLDNPDEMNDFIEKITPFCNQLFDAAANSPAEVILSGANYDVSITDPNMFAQYITPVLKAQSDRLHTMGKFLVIHTDGENTKLMQEYVAANIDIADSICPSPMTKMSLADCRRDFSGAGITIWGGIPSVSVLESTMNDKTFEEYIDHMFSDIGAGDHLIFSIADTVPPAAKWDRVLHIAKKAQAFGAVKESYTHHLKDL